MKPCFIYLYGHQRAGGIAGPIRIGVTDDPDGCLQDSSAACAYPIVSICNVATPSRGLAQAIEAQIHADLNKHRSNGNWFEVTPFEAVEAFLIVFREEYLLAGFSEIEFFDLAQKNGLADILTKYTSERGRFLVNEGQHE